MLLSQERAAKDQVEFDPHEFFGEFGTTDEFDDEGGLVSDDSEPELNEPPPLSPSASEATLRSYQSTCRTTTTALHGCPSSTRMSQAQRAATAQTTGTARSSRTARYSGLREAKAAKKAAAAEAAARAAASAKRLASGGCTSLNLQLNRIGSLGCAYLCGALRQSTSQIATLALQGNELGEQSGSDSSGPSLTKPSAHMCQACVDSDASSGS